MQFEKQRLAKLDRLPIPQHNNRHQGPPQVPFAWAPLPLPPSNPVPQGGGAVSGGNASRGRGGAVRGRGGAVRGGAVRGGRGGAVRGRRGGANNWQVSRGGHAAAGGVGRTSYAQPASSQRKGPPVNEEAMVQIYNQRKNCKVSVEIHYNTEKHLIY